MNPQQIGLEAVMPMKDFMQSMKSYMGGIDQMNKETASFVGKGAAHFQSFGKSVLGATAVMGGAMVAAAAGAGIAIGKFTVDGIKAAADLESRMSGIAAVLNLTTEQAKPLKTLIMDLAINPNLKVDTEGAADAIENLARNGLNASQIIGGVAESVVLLSNATGGEFGPAADVVTDIMAQFNKTAGETAEIVNGVVGVTNASKMSFDDYRLAIGQAGGVAGAMGVSLEDFNAALAATAPLFNSGSDAGTGFKSFLNSLIPTTKEQKKAFRELGLEFYDSSGQMKDMAVIAEELNEKLFQEVTFTKQVNNMTAEQSAQKKILEQTIASTNKELYKYSVNINGTEQSEAAKIVSVDRLNRKHDAAIAAYEGLAGVMGTTVSVTRELTEAERNRFLELAFGTDGSRAAIGLAEAGAVAYADAALAAKELGVSQAEVNKFIEGGVTAYEVYLLTIAKADALEQAKTRNDNLKAAFEILRDTIKAVQLAIGDQFLPVLRQLTEWATTWVNANSPAIIAAFTAFAANLGTLINYLTVVVTDGDLMNDWLTHMSPSLQAIVLGTIEWVSWIQQTVAAIQSFLEPVTTAIASFVSWKDVLVVLGLAVASVVIPAIWGMIAALTPVIVTVGAVLLAVSALRNAWESDFLGIQTATTSAIAYMSGALEPFTAAVSQHMAGALAEIKAWVTGNETEFTHVKAIWDGAKTSGMTMFGDLKNYVTTNLPIWTATLTEWGTAAAVWIIDAIPVVTAKLTEWYTALSTYINANLPAWIAALSVWGDAAWAWITEASGVVVGKLGEWWAKILAAVTGYLPTFIANLKLWAGVAWEWITEAANLVAGKLGEWWKAISNYVTANLPAWKQKLTEWATAAWQWIVTSSDIVAAKLGVWFAKLTAFVVANLPSWIAILKNWTIAAWQWIVDADAQLPAKLSEWWTKLSTSIGPYLLSFTKEMLKWATALVTWISDNAADAIPHLGTWLGKILAWIPLAGIALAIKTVQLGNALIGWIADTIIKVGPELLSLTGALLVGLGKMHLAVIQGMKNFSIAWWNTVKTAVDWNQLGQDILTAVKDGWELAKQTLIDAAAAVVASVKSVFRLASWTSLGSTILGWITDGFGGLDVVKSLIDKATEIVGKVKSAITDVDWLQLGKDIVQGIIDGIVAMKDTFIEKALAIFDALPDAVKALFGIDSPSKLFMEIGKNVILGYVKGLEDTWNKYKGNIFDNLPGLGPLKFGELPSGLQKVTAMFNSLTSAAKTFAEMSGNKLAGFRVADMETSSNFLNAQLDLLSQIESLGIDPRRILGDKQLGLSASAYDLAEITSKLAVMARSKLNDEIAKRQTAALATFVLQPFTTWLGSQTKTLETVLTKTVSEFGKLRVDRLLQKVNTLDQQIANYTNSKYPLNLTAQLTLSDLLVEREKLINQIGSISSVENIFGIESDRNAIDLMKKQVDLLTQAKELGVFLPANAFDSMANDSTLSALTVVLANIQHTQAAQLQKQLDILRTPDPQADRLKTLEAQQAALDEQVTLLQKVKSLGMQLSGEYNLGLSMTKGDLRNLTIRSSEVQLQRTLNELSLVERLSPELLNPQATGTVAQLYKAQVLDPMLKTLREAVMLESDRVALIEQYRQKAMELASIENKQKQLDFLMMQNDLLNQLDDELPRAIELQVLAGTKFGLDAKLEDLLAFAGRMTDALVKKVKGDMGIASPSKVFMRIGQNVMAGFSRGINSMAAQPIQAFQQALRPLPYAMSGRALSMNMGGVTINNGMDEVMFEARVRQVVEGLI